MLPDIQTFGEFIKYLAAKRYRESHPDKERLPKGFRQQMTMCMSGISSGSTEVELLFTVHGQQHICPTDEESCYYDSVGEAMGVFERLNDDNSELPDDLTPFFNKFGRGLKENESIEIKSSGRKVEFNKELRHAVLTRASKPFVEEIQMYGTVKNLNLQQERIDITTNIGGNTITIPVNVDMNDWAGYYIGNLSHKISQSKVYLEGIGEFNDRGKLLSVKEVCDIQLLDPLDIRARIEELSHLEDGWLDKTGKGISEKGAKMLSDLFDQHYDRTLPLPYIFPTENGEIQAEWSIGVNEIILRVNLETLSGRLIVINTETDSEEENEYELPDKSSWDKINSLMREALDEK